MENSVHFYQHCPVCGRSLRIRVTLLGETVYCQHCGGGFTSRDESTTEVRGADMTPPIAVKVEDLLARATLVLARSAACCAEASHD
jgi:C4-type Zn-finger protein